MKQVEDGSDEYLLFLGQMPFLEDRLGKQFGRFEPIAYTSQVVAGTVFQVKIRVSDEPTGYVHAKIFRPLPHSQQEPELQASKEGQTVDSPFDWSTNKPVAAANPVPVAAANPVPVAAS